MFRKIMICATAFCVSAAVLAVPQANPQKAWRPVKAAVQQKAEKAVPKILNEKMVVCGNKKIMLGQDGTLIISNASGMISKIVLANAFVEKKSGNIDWIPFTSNVCKVRLDNDKVVWSLSKTRHGKTFKVAEQTLEVMPDGLIKLSGVFESIDNADIKYRNNGSFFVYVPVSGNEGRNIVFNGSRKMEISPSLKHSEWRLNDYKYTVFPEAPADTFSLLCRKPEIQNATLYRVGKDMRFTYIFPEARTGVICLDLRTSAAEKVDAANTGAGVDFKKVENLELPYKDKNLVFNSSFEQNKIGWTVHAGLRGNYDGGEPKWNSNPFVIKEGGFHGKHALLVKGRFSTHPSDYRNIIKGVNITSPTVFLNPGKYTVSFYAKQVKGKPCYFNVWNHNFNIRNSTIFLPPTDEGAATFTPTREWKRYSHTFTISKACPTAFSFNVNGAAEVLLDAVQVEAGTKATKYSFPAAEGLLVTSVADNFLDSKDKVDARVRVFTAPAASGKVSVRVKNFFDEVVYKGTFPFKADQAGYVTLALPFENLGKGLFTVRFDFTLSDGRKSHNHTRYAVVDYLKNTHRLKNIFSDDYGTIEKHHQFIRILERYRKLGFGAKAHMFTWEKAIWDKYREYGVEPLHACLGTTLWRPGTTKVSNFGIKYVETPVNLASDKDLAIGDHNISNNGELDEAYLKKLTEVTANVARKYPHIKLWMLLGEMRAKFAKEWWSKAATEEEASRCHALYLKAFSEGIRKGNPEAQIFQDDPCNMRPEGGIAETAELLENCNKLGVKFDVIAIHPYRYSPESPDLDADAALFFKTIDAKGYRNAKGNWPEMMHWGPFEIPQWGTQSSTWGNVPQTWPGWTVSYDIGATEKRSAAWRARAWLVALKYSDRLLTATAGGTANNFCMDEELTPYCSSLMPNTLGNLLGDSKFVKDIRFAPFCRSYIFTDQKNRPVAAVWCHLDKVDFGYIDAPVAEADFGNSLESVIDLMNNKRAFNSGKFKFPVSSFPIFLRGKPGTLKQMISALSRAEIISGEGISPFEVSCNPAGDKNAKITFKNLLSRDFEGTFNGKAVKIPGSGKTDITIGLAKKISANAVSKFEIPAVFKTSNGQKFDYDLSFEALSAKRVAEDFALEKDPAWSKLPAVKFTRKGGKGEISGNFRLGWNSKGLFIQVQVKDKKFCHTEYKNTHTRWKNDCLQIYFDTMANARFRQFKGYDEDDYDYAVFPDSEGKKSIVWRNRSVEQQLGLATQAPQDMTVAHDIPSSFTNKNGVHTYRVFFPAKYLLPVKLRAGWVMGLGLYVGNVDIPGGKVTSNLTLSNTGESCYNAPHTYPALLLID